VRRLRRRAHPAHRWLVARAAIRPKPDQALTILTAARPILGGITANRILAAMPLARFDVFDAHLHIVDPRFALIANHGYLPPPFTVDDYRHRMAGYRLRGGAIVSGSFQVYDQDYLIDALQRLGPWFVGVTQLPASVSDQRLLELDHAGVRALRFNLRRGGSEDIAQLERMARRVHELAHWHVELYADVAALVDLRRTLIRLPAVSIDHLGLTRAGLPVLLDLVAHGVRVKATGFGRVDFEVAGALRALYRANPDALMFGTDLPSTRAPRPYSDADVALIVEALGDDAQAQRVLHGNAHAWYRPRAHGVWP
jgi:predicted TIM-barrel fold metal-dependent hydrolase